MDNCETGKYYICHFRLDLESSISYPHLVHRTSYFVLLFSFGKKLEREMI